MRVLARLWRDERASTATEYAVIAALVGVAALVGYVLYAGAVEALYAYVGDNAGAALVP